MIFKYTVQDVVATRPKAYLKINSSGCYLKLILQDVVATRPKVYLNKPYENF